MTAILGLERVVSAASTCRTTAVGTGWTVGSLCPSVENAVMIGSG